MIVMLHGFPGDNGGLRPYDTRTTSFMYEIGIVVAHMPPFSLSDSFEQEAPAIQAEYLVFSWWHFDGTHHHYTLANNPQYP